MDQDHLFLASLESASEVDCRRTVLNMYRAREERALTVLRAAQTEARYAGIAQAVGGKAGRSATAARSGNAAISNDSRRIAGRDDDRAAPRGGGNRVCA